jgi:azobenzene reductase
LIITGSLRRPSYTCGLGYALAVSLQDHGMSATVFDQRDTPLALHDSVFHKAPEDNPDPAVSKLIGLANKADGFVLASPIYHNGPSGVLKNALDHLAIAQLAYKPVGLVSHGGNRSSQAVDQMRIWVRGLLGHAIGTQICTQDSDFGTTHEGDPAPQSAAIAARMNRFCHELGVFTQTLSIARPALGR